MKFLALIASSLALAGAAVAQEAARFGSISVIPSTVKPGQTFTVHYNSTTATHQPIYYDAYIQGTVKATNFVGPQFLLGRNTFPTNGTKIFDFETTLPALLPNDPTLGYNNQTGYAVWAWITFPIDDSPGAALEYDGVEGTINIDLS